MSSLMIRCLEVRDLWQQMSDDLLKKKNQDCQ